MYNVKVRVPREWRQFRCGRASAAQPLPLGTIVYTVRKDAHVSDFTSACSIYYN